MKKTIISVLLIIIIAFSGEPAAAANSIADIKAAWLEMQPAFEGYKYVEEPATEYPYSPGILADGFLQDGLNMVNFMRYLAGIPSDLVLDTELCEEGQYGAVLLATSDFSHTPVQPTDMDDSFYDYGYATTSSSNIYVGFGSLADSVVGYMDDSNSASNLALVGHRRWTLNPQMKKTGFGEAHNYGLMRVFDRSRTTNFDYDYVTWPNAGDAPNNFFRGDTAWSVSPNPAEFDRTVTDSITVKLTRESDGYSWEFDKTDADASGKYFNVDTGGYGTPFCIIFRPDHITNYEAGETYHVDIYGLQDKSGNPLELAYSVSFFDLYMGPTGNGQDIEAFVARFYEECFDRTPDQNGLDYWVSLLESGEKTGADVAYGFVYGDEFQDQDLLDEDYLNILYAAFFNRETDNSGLNYWMDRMGSGTSRIEVLAGFVNADEFGELCDDYGITKGIIVLPDDDLAAFVARFYQLCLGRAPDQAGLDYWLDLLESGEQAGADIAYGFVYSNEFQAQDLTDEEYLAVLYMAILGREADDTGLTYWLSLLENGAGRLEVLAGFVNANEFAELCGDYGIEVGDINI